MVLSYYVLKLPYAIAWHVKSWRRKLDDVVFYCGTELDIAIFAPVQKYLKPLPVVAKDRKVQAKLRELGIVSTLLPCFPRGVIMARHAAYKFPCNKITRICLSHGAYNFKRFASADSHNMLDAYFFTSKQDVANAQAAGIRSGVAVGYPKLDKAFDGSISAAMRAERAERMGLDPQKPTILFTATWDKSGISAVTRWYDRLAEFTPDYNVLVTVHPWTSAYLQNAIKATPGVHLIQGYDLLVETMLADVCIGDTSSIIGDCCALDKPLVTFRVPENERSVPAIMEMIRMISDQVDSVEALRELLPRVIADPARLAPQRAVANRMMFDELDGQAGRRAAGVILSYFPQLARED